MAYFEADKGLHNTIPLEHYQSHDKNLDSREFSSLKTAIIKRSYSSYPIANYKSCVNLTRDSFGSGNSDSIGIILAERKILFSRRKRVADIMFILSTFGIVLMMIMVELLFRNPLNDNKIYDSDLFTKKKSEFISQIVFILRCLISFSTGLLLFFIFIYHQIEIKIHCINNHTNDPYALITKQKIFSVFLEFCVCAIHPIPSSLDVQTESKITLIEESSPVMPVPTIIILSILMFLRCYQICRVIVFHSRLFENSSSRSLGYLNKIELNFKFLFKTYMHSAPWLVLLFMLTILFTASGWIMMACEYPANTKKFDYLNSLWLIAITFLTVGYGDLFPITSCGRFVAVITAILGGFWIALTVTFLTKRLEFTRGEKYFYKFVTEIELLKKFKNASANLLKRSWLNYKTRKNKGNNVKEILKNERLLQSSVREIRKLKEKARKYQDLMINLEWSDDIKSEKLPHLNNYNSNLTVIEKKIDKIEINLRLIEEKMNKICNLFEKK